MQTIQHPGDHEHPVTDQIKDAVRPLKPKLRGWLHASWVPVSVAAGIVLIVLAHSPAGRIGGAVFLAASLLLFGTSAFYHRGKWSLRTEQTLRRMDHANIFAFIAATYTPMALLLLQGTSRVILLTTIWVAAVFGMVFRIAWLAAPRALYTVLYLAMGWAAVGWMPQFLATGGPVFVGLIMAGGLLYTIGALAYAFKRPDPWPTWYGYHEIFHTCTIGAFACHYSAILLATLR